MKFSEAFEKMKSGAKVKLPSWDGYAGRRLGVRRVNNFATSQHM